jgi:CxxC-x17-CxxC domain-containing protein
MGKFKSERKFERRESRRPSRSGSSGFEREERFSNKFGRGSPDRFERRGGSGFRKQMHEVICDKCGEKCEVPFRPTSNKPVYCSDCFRKKEHTESRKAEAPMRNDSQAELELINQKLDRILELLEEN